ncbi:SH3 domain-containing protein [Oryctes borbonicus]|uniref:SH3 domain-containing protein n=1 Tax=Oryctes borbonicus TaxID=1629725 RepID=A0A0T6BDD2_9SCAR|nr:SH3 domain-containing protein [Oryctes borbonicus]
MGIFGGSTKHDADVEKATDAQSSTEDWAVIMDICDKAGKNTEEAKNYLKVIMKRLSNADPHIALLAVTLLDACVKNSGKTFHLEIASRDFENEYIRLLTKSHPKVVQKLKESLKKWAEEDAFKNDPQLNLIPSLYVKLKNEGIDFSVETPTKKTVALSKDPNVVQSQEEEDQIAKAIELSLKEASSSPRNYASTLSSSLYPSTNLSSTATASATPQKEPRKVRALYDFEAAEDNELTFTSGELILVIDDSDPNWWKGTNHRGEGLFPANFVTSDLNAELEPEKKKKVDFEEDNAKSSASSKLLKDLENVEINEEKIDRLLHLFHEADPTNSDKDTQEMQDLEREVNIMGPLIDTELERIDRKHAQLTQLSSDLVEALNLYHTLMPEPVAVVAKAPFGYPPGMAPMHPVYNGTMPPSMLPASMMGPPFTSLPPGQERPPFMMHSNMPLPHFPPGMQPPPAHMMHQQQQHAMGSMPPMSIVPHPMPSQALPSGLHQPGSQQTQTLHRMPPQSMPPQAMPPQSMPQGPFPPSHAIPNFVPNHMPPNFNQSGPHMTPTSIQNGPPAGQTTSYQQTSTNTHIM